MVQLPTSHLGAGERVYPLGLSRLSSLVPRAMEKQVLDMNIHPDPWAGLKTLLEETNPDIVVFSFRNIDPLAGHQASYLSSLKTAALLARRLVPNSRILAGGPAFSMFAHRLMQEVPQIDIGLTGEGEYGFPRLIEPSINPEKIPGILWRQKDRLNSNPRGPKVVMADLPAMDLNSFPPEDYTRGNAYVAAMGIEGKRGCDLHCGYCLYPFLGGTRMRLRNPLAIADEIEVLNKAHGIKVFHFTDPVVNRPSDHFEQLCRELIARNLKIEWTGFFREDSLTGDNLALAKRAGLAAIYFSGDALNNYGLKLLNKQLTKESILNASRLTVQEGVLTMCHFLLDLPGETDDHCLEAEQMLDAILDIHSQKGNLGAIIFNKIRLYPGAPITKKLIKSGQLSNETDLLYPVYHTSEKNPHLLHEFEARCHAAGVFSRLGIKRNEL